MRHPPTTNYRSYGVFSLAILLLILGGAAIYLGSHDFSIRSLGLVACLASAHLIRTWRVRGRKSSALVIDRSMGPGAETGPARSVWIIGAALVPVAVLSYLYLYQDAQNGYHEVLPVYVFAGVAIICAGVWSYLASRL